MGVAEGAGVLDGSPRVGGRPDEVRGAVVALRGRELGHVHRGTDELIGMGEREGRPVLGEWWASRGT